MVDRTQIEWTDATWNPVRGCSRASAGCANCYAEAMAERFSGPGQWGHGIAERGRGWTGAVILDEKALLKPLSWRKPRRIFVTSIGDPFHSSVTDEILDRMFAVMALCPQHTFQLLTKRPERMMQYITSREVMVRGDNYDFLNSEFADAARTVSRLAGRLIWQNAPLVYWNAGTHEEPVRGFPLPNLWLGTSVENQAAADERIPHLLATTAAKRFLSCEPLLGPVKLTAMRSSIWDEDVMCDALTGDWWTSPQQDEPNKGAGLDWVIVGGESGPNARPMHPDWARSLRDQCAAPGVSFFFKQWGEWAWGGRDRNGWYFYPDSGGTFTPNPPDHDFGDGYVANRVGKRAAGHLLDGCEHREVPHG